MERQWSERRAVRFSGFDLDLRTGILRQGRERIPLQEMPFQVLAVLLERPGELVTRQELRQRLFQELMTDVQTDVDEMRSRAAESRLPAKSNTR